MSLAHPDELPRLEAALRDDPNSLDLREKVLEACSGDPKLHGSDIQVETILWFVRNHPENLNCRIPFTSINPEVAPEAYDTIRKAWMDRVAASPRDGLILRGAAAFVAAGDIDEAVQLLRKAVEAHPTDAEARVDLGRATRDPGERLTHFIQARDLGSTQPNLAVWIATSAAGARDWRTAECEGRALLRRVAALRDEHGDRLDWKEAGHELRRRAVETTGDTEKARELVRAIAEHANKKHWAHTVLGLVALGREDTEEAVTQLRASAAVRPDHRLSAYGPSHGLVYEVCKSGLWDAAEEYLQAWVRMVETPWLMEWLEAVRRRELPHEE